MPNQRSLLLAVVVVALLGGGAVVAAVLSRHSSRFLAGRAFRAPEARAALRRSLEARREELAETLRQGERAAQAANDPGTVRVRALRAAVAGHELGSVSSALLPLLEEGSRAEAEQRLSEVRRALADLDRLAERQGGGVWTAAGEDPRAACAANCLGPRDRCWAAAGGDAPKCRGLALEAAGCVAGCR